MSTHLSTHTCAHTPLLQEGLCAVSLLAGLLGSWSVLVLCQPAAPPDSWLLPSRPTRVTRLPQSSPFITVTDFLTLVSCLSLFAPGCGPWQRPFLEAKLRPAACVLMALLLWAALGDGPGQTGHPEGGGCGSLQSCRDRMKGAMGLAHPRKHWALTLGPGWKFRLCVCREKGG